MSEIRLVVRESAEEWSGTIHASCADVAIAALSADPTTLAELESACGRFARVTPKRRFLGNLQSGTCAEPSDAGLIVIDLAARLVVADSSWSSYERVGGIPYHTGHGGKAIVLPYHIADDWLFIENEGEWRAVAKKRRQEREAMQPLFARDIFYGHPLLEFIARESFEAFSRPARQVANDDVRGIHAAWLLTPRTDLRGLCPREVALQRRKHLSWDLQDQCERWSLLNQCPPGLAKSSFAFRYGGFGTHELVQYYELVRELLCDCRERLVELSEGKIPGIADFLAQELPRLEVLRDEWLHTPDPELHGRTPQSIIDRERARLPEGMSGREAMIDADCPCCQMVAELPGPMFWHLDGCNMDDEFAFDIYHETRGEWDAEQQRYEDFNKQFEADRLKRKVSGIEEQPVWSASYTAENVDDMPLGIRLFGIGAHLADLIGDLRGESNGGVQVAQAKGFVDRLNREFGNLREILQNTEPSVAESLLRPVVEKFTDTLNAVALACPVLSEKCESLTRNTTRFLDLDSFESRDESEDMPF